MSAFQYLLSKSRLSLNFRLSHKQVDENVTDLKLKQEESKIRTLLAKVSKQNLIDGVLQTVRDAPCTWKPLKNTLEQIATKVTEEGEMEEHDENFVRKLRAEHQVISSTGTKLLSQKSAKLEGLFIAKTA